MVVSRDSDTAQENGHEGASGGAKGDVKHAAGTGSALCEQTHRVRSACSV